MVLLLSHYKVNVSYNTLKDIFSIIHIRLYIK